jgi:hypothetical protein
MLIVVGKAVVGIGKMVTVVKALNTAMLKNPFVLIGAGLLLVFNHAEKANKESRKLIQTVRELGKEGGSIEDLSKAIEAQEQLIEAQKKVVLETHRDIGARNKAKEKLQEYKDALADLNAELGRQQLAFSESLIEQRKQVEIADEVVDANEEIRKSVEKIRVLMDEPLPSIFDPTDVVIARMLNEEFREFENTLYEIATASFDFSHRLDEVTKSSNKSTLSIGDFGMVAAQAFDRLVFSGEKLGSILSSIARQFASKALMTGLQMLLGGGAGMGISTFGGFFKKVIGVDDAMITSSGNVVKFHPDDNILAMKDFSKLGAMGGGQRVEVFGKISGQDIFISSDRGGSSFNR